MWSLILTGLAVCATLLAAAFSVSAKTETAWFSRLTVGNPEFQHPNAIAFVGSNTTRQFDLSSTRAKTLHGLYVAPHFRITQGDGTYSAIVAAPIVSAPDGEEHALGHLAGVRIIAPVIGEGADVWHNYGLLIEPQVAAGTKDPWMIMVKDGGRSYLGGDTLLRQPHLLDEHGQWRPVTLGPPDSCGAGRRCVTAAN